MGCYDSGVGFMICIGSGGLKKNTKIFRQKILSFYNSVVVHIT